MQYSPMEQECLELWGRTDFKNPSKDEIVSLVSKLHQMKPEVAQEIIKQFPEFVSVVKTSMTEYRGILESIIESDDKSTEQVFDVVNHDMDNTRESREAINAMATTVLSDLSKSLDNPDLSVEERNAIFDRQERILNMVSQKDTEIRQQEAKDIQTAERVATEKRNFNWDVIKAASCVVLGSLIVTAGVISGGDVKLKLPKK
ncbi:MAG: hypothetical protein J1F04_09345 [Oscillospiraceae bacterium]|nr:hypothetical protein [Oscillospiraceae bacterium]